MSTMSCCDSVPALFEDNLFNQVKPKSVFYLFFFLSFFLAGGVGGIGRTGKLFGGWRWVAWQHMAWCLVPYRS